jgi:transcriptional regulator with XRE-family HTH domain
MDDNVLRFPAQHHARTSTATAPSSTGHKSGRSSLRETPVARSIDKTNSAGTPRFDLVSQYQTCDCVVPIRSAKGFCPPATSHALFKASVDMTAQYPNLGASPPKTLSQTNNRKFGSLSSMKEPIDPREFGRRVKERRDELGWSQKRLGQESEISQQNIGWIEDGGPKHPQKQALALAMALRTTTDWLLYGRGPRDAGPRVLTTEQFTQVYSALPVEAQEALTALAEKYQVRKKRA